MTHPVFAASLQDRSGSERAYASSGSYGSGNDVDRLGIIAGEGELPVHVARNARQRGMIVVTFSLGRSNRQALKKICNGKLHVISPGLLDRTLELLKQESIRHLVLAGKVDKWILFRDPRLDKRAMSMLRQLHRKNDDSIMMELVNGLEAEGIHVVKQTDYLQNLFLPAGVLTKKYPDAQDMEDIRYAFGTAKEIGRLDIGQTIAVRQGMVLAVEAIEGTDECLRRAGKWGRKRGGVVMKVAKPDQDQRFDVPTVGLRTLQTMRQSGLHCLATEAGKTLYIEPEAMIAYADRHGIVITSVDMEAFGL